MFRIRSSIFSLAVLVPALLAGARPASAQTQPTGTWASETGGIQFSEGACAADSTNLYIFGGYQPGASPSGYYYRATRRYDPATNAWTSMADMPQDCYYNTGAFHNGFIYSFGNAYYGNGAIYRYNVSADSWTQMTSVNLSNNRFYASAATLGAKIYICGGGYYSYSNLCDEFDPAANSGNGSITARAPMPIQTQGSAVAGIDALNKLYVIGGYSDQGVSAGCWEYTPPDTDPGTTTDNSWSTKTSMVNSSNQQQPREWSKAFTVANRVYVTGGYYNGYQNTNYEYNPITDQWVQRANMSQQRYLHAAAAIGTKGYAYGGIPSYTTTEEYTPPAFGSPPNAPTDAGQAGSQTASSLQALDDSSQVNGWTNSQVTFSATVTDPDAGQQVRLRVQIRPENVTSWTSSQVVSLQTPLGAQGFKTLNWTIPTGAGFDWRWRVEDTFGNSHPVTANTWIDAFGTTASPNVESPDFRSDQVSPTDPVGLEPSNDDIQVPHPDVGNVTLSWIEATDNGPVSGISYELQVARDGGFNDIEAQLFSPAGTSSYPVALSVSRVEKFWRIRARDVGGNFSQWSAPLGFRVTHNDGVDHSSGDAKKNCGFGAVAIPVLPAALMGLLLLGMSAGRRMNRKT